MTNVFVAPKIKVGFQKRSDTFTGQLAYIIYYDEKGKIRKEKSWNSWRDHKIAPQEFDNAPMDGFTLNKDVKRYSGEWFSSHRTMIRVHDPRGFEFEVTTENLIGILMHTDCLRRGLIGQFVYAWVGPELVLLPTNSEEYQNAAKYTTGLAKKVSAKDLVPGISYKTKREGNVIYIGRLNWYEYARKGGKYSDSTGQRTEDKVHVFTADEGKTFMKKSGADFLSEANSDQPVANFAELMQKFNRKSYANKVVKVEFRPVTFDPTMKKAEYDYYGPKLARDIYFVESSIPGVFAEKHVSAQLKRESTAGQKDTFTVTGFEVGDDYYRKQGMRPPTGELVDFPEEKKDRWGYSYYHDRNPKALTLAEMQSQPFFDLIVTFENGKERNVRSLYHFTQEEY